MRSWVDEALSRSSLSLPGVLTVSVVLLLLYSATMARSLVLGDPTEYTFVAHILGIAHPPGYAFITLAGHLFQTLIPVGSIPWRMHLLSVVAGTLAALFVFGTVWITTRKRLGLVAALFAAFTVATATNFWQHSIHANPHIITATFLAANLFFLSGWARGKSTEDKAPSSDNWLYAFALSAGLGVTHHPLTVFAWPAYALFILLVRPSIIRQWRTLLKMAGFGLLGLSVWLYFPIRSAMEPAFGPHDMDTLEGFLNVVLARGLRVNLFHFGLADQFDRLLVVWTLLRLQYSLPVVGLALIGIASLLSRFTFHAPGFTRPLAALYLTAFALNLAFVINTVQDVMAYLLGPFLIVGLLAGIGFYALLHFLESRSAQARVPLALLALALFLTGPLLQVARNLPRVSLREYNEGRAYIEAVFERFEDSGAGAVLLNDWEHMTPLWYSRYVEERWPDPVDVRPEFVSAARPWLPSVFDYLGGGPVFLSGYRREIVDAGFRLRPRGEFYQVVEPGEETLPPEVTAVEAHPAASDAQLVGYSMPEQAVTAGDIVPLVLAMRTPEGTADYYVPVLTVGALRLAFTTDSHLVSPLWQPDEVIVERFDFALPHHLPTGRYEVEVALQNLSTNEEGAPLVLGTLEVSAQVDPPRTEHLLANFRQRVGLASAMVTAQGQKRSAPWEEPLAVEAGDIVHLTLEWESLARAEESYTVFVHLIDPANQLIAPPLDYTPLGGAAPTYLWIPRWLPGQRLLDPYRMLLPPDQPPGTYFIEVGLYEMTSGRRLHMSDQDGNLIGDRYILGPLVVGDP